MCENPVTIHLIAELLLEELNYHLSGLTDQAAFMRTDGVEIAQDAGRQLGVGLGSIGDDALDHQLGLSVGVGRRKRKILLDRHRLRQAVYGRRGREDQAMNAVFFHTREKEKRTGQIVVIVAKRLLARLTDGLQTGEVDNGGNVGMGRKNAIQRLLIEKVALDEFGTASRDGFDAVQHAKLTVGQVIDDNDVLANAKQLNDGMRADVTGTACN